MPEPTPGEVRELIALFVASLQSLRDPIEGFEDIMALDVQPETRAAAEDRKRVFEARKKALEVAVKALQDLLDNGYPRPPALDVPQEIIDDILEQRRTIDAAFAFFKGPQPATQLHGAVTPTEKVR